ncbi:MAG: VOC family protein [Planctomycetota bacterium]
MPIRYVHTNIVARDWRLLAQFYETVFDCRPVLPARSLSGEWLEAGTAVPNASLEGIHLRLPGFGEDGPTLEIFQYGHIESKLPSVANREGFGHLAFAVDDVEAKRANVLANGGNDIGQIVEADIDGVGKRSFCYMADPEGNLIEVQKWG